MLTEILIVAALILLNGALAMSELAVVSSRPARLKPLAENGSTGAAAALKLAEDPGRFLSTVQIGITLVGVLSGAFSGATLGARLSGWLAAQGVTQQWADWLGVGGRRGSAHLSVADRGRTCAQADRPEEPRSASQPASPRR